MRFKTLQHCIAFLEKEKELVRITEPVNPYLEMAEITRQVFEAGGPALFFMNVPNSPFPAVSNLFGTYERTLKIFEPELKSIQALIDIRSDIRSDPGLILKKPGRAVQALPSSLHSLPLKSLKPQIMENCCGISDLPMIQCYPKDGGAFILLPQVFSTDPDTDSIFSSNLGMYRIQISGNDYLPGKEIGLHYQLHRGIGEHHLKALKNNQPLKVSIFIGGPPAHTLAAVMPLPEGVPEILFAGALAGRNFRYARKDGYVLSADADFCITGIVVQGKTKPEGPFGDHLGYYSLVHNYPYLKVTNVYHRKDAVFPFTVVGRPPQEDSNFGRLIHEITKPALTASLPGITAVHAVDETGVHPLLLVKAHERYIPYRPLRPRELMTHAHRVLGFGQLSLAKYIMICAEESEPAPDVNDTRAFIMHMLERLNFSEDLHFITKTTMDTLDYSGQTINQGSKLILAAAGPKRRSLQTCLPGADLLSGSDEFTNARLIAPGIAIIKGPEFQSPEFQSYDKAQIQINKLKMLLKEQGDMSGIPLLVIVDDSDFCAASFSNFLWITFLRSNPSHDIYGLDETISFKHWECREPLIIDARIKPFHAPILERDPEAIAKVKELGKKGGPLFGII